MSFQITILKVLAGHPGGHASLADLKHAVAILISSGPDWTERTERLVARTPNLDIFSQLLVLRNDDGWQITRIDVDESATLGMKLTNEIAYKRDQVKCGSARRCAVQKRPYFYLERKPSRVLTRINLTARQRLECHPTKAIVTLL